MLFDELGVHVNGQFGEETRSARIALIDESPIRPCSRNQFVRVIPSIFGVLIVHLGEHFVDRCCFDSDRFDSRVLLT